jgi:L-serine/L-threonine ammonia-lyase
LLALLADDHHLVVEPACGASLSAVYSGVLQRLQEEGQLPKINAALVIVCGGAVVTLELLNKWKQQFSL